MNDRLYPCDFPVQYLNELGEEAYRRAEAEIEAEAQQLREAAGDVPFPDRGPMTIEHVRGWLHEGVGDLRISAFGTTAWGSIRWDRSLGRPQTARMADAFSFHHWSLWVEVMVDANGRPVVKEIWSEHPEPRSWDGPHDDESYRVSFMLRAAPGLVNRFWPEMHSNVEWEPAFPPWSTTRRRLLWPDHMLPFGSFKVHRDDALVFDEYQVIRRFY